ncbi:MAG: hypothetical protein M1831_002008 [Alyxoria varia]|nr:MAG: hypothetical protein M1831_002008 [Alyxoria varia]
MAPTNPAHVRTQTHLLINKVLEFGGAGDTKNGKAGQSISPFMLILDSLEMPAMAGLHGGGLVGEICGRVKQSKTASRTIFISFETLRPPENVDSVVRAHNACASPATISKLAKDVQLAITEAAKESANNIILVIDTLHALATQSHSNTYFSLPSYLTGLLTPPPSHPNVSINLLACYHTSLPSPTILSPPSTDGSAPSNPYAPNPLTLLLHLATTVKVLHSFPQNLEKRAVRSRAQVEPGFGLVEGIDGVVQGLGSCGGVRDASDRRHDRKSKAEASQGVVVEMQHRRRSGRGIVSSFVLERSLTPTTVRANNFVRSTVTLLRDHAAYQAASGVDTNSGSEGGAASTQDGEVESTFSMGLTEKQRKDREGVVLPYYDAQRGGVSEIAGDLSVDGRSAEGGRILYDMGVEDDFDEEEDEI